MKRVKKRNKMVVEIYDETKNYWYYTAITHYNHGYTHSNKCIYESHNYNQIKRHANTTVNSIPEYNTLVYYGTRVYLYKTFMPFHFYERNGVNVKPIHVFNDPLLKKIIFIQRWWREIKASQRAGCKKRKHN